jgi:plasmid stabilization system protein ParE
MKVVLSARVEADIARQLQYSLEHFGPNVAQRTFTRVDSFIFRLLPANPRIGRYLPDRNIHEAWIGRTPFVIFYRLSAEADTITVLALFHRAQNRAAFNPDD